MTIRDVETILTNFSAGILEYEDGDLMLMSDLIDKAASIEKEFGIHRDLDGLFPNILEILKYLLDGGEYRQVDDVLSQGIDLLSRIVRDMQRGDIALTALAKSGILKKYLEETTQFTEIADHRLQTIKSKQAGEARPAAGVKELEMRINSEPFKVFLAEAVEKVL
ncbi:MAG: hypothetical protein JW904_03055 [Spirochaetales bacterium]|nr:hypothetical protein [Spirochaetales bacterium]